MEFRRIPGLPPYVFTIIDGLKQEARRAGLAELAAWAADGVRGEVTVVVAGAGPVEAAAPEDLVAEVEGLVAAGVRLKEATAEVANRQGVSRRVLYDAVLAARD